MTGLLIKNPIVDLPIKMKENSKRTLGNSLSAWGGGGGGGGARTRIWALLRRLLTELKLRLRRRLTVRGRVVFGEIKNQFYIKRNRQIWPCD